MKALEIIESEFAGTVAKARDLLHKRLIALGIEDNVVIRVKPVHSERRPWIALYRSLTQFRGGRPIFWIADNFEEICRQEIPDENPFSALMTTLYHEYGHVIEEWAREGGRSGLEGTEQALQLIQQNFSNMEDYAEDFARFMDGWPESDVHSQIIKMYRRSTFE